MGRRLATEAELLGLALTGELLPLVAPDPAGMSAELVALGWDTERLGELRRARQGTREPWPFPVPLEDRRAVGFARFDALLAELRRELGLTGLAATPSARRPLDRDEQRLAAERPPHW